MWNSLIAIAAGAALDYYGSELIFYVLGAALLPIPLPGMVVIGLWVGVGLGMDVAGGFLTGVLAKRRKTLHAAVTGAIIFAIWAVPVWRNHPLLDWVDIVSAALQMPCEILGGFLAGRIRPRRKGPGDGNFPPIADPF